MALASPRSCENGQRLPISTGIRNFRNFSNLPSDRECIAFYSDISAQLDRGTDKVEYSSDTLTIAQKVRYEQWSSDCCGEKDSPAPDKSSWPLRLKQGAGREQVNNDTKFG